MSNLLFTLAVEASIRAAILLAAVALILALFRIRSSGTRHAAWATALVVMLLMPVLTRVVPAIHVSVPERARPLMPASPVRQIDTPLPELPASMTSRQGGTTSPPVATPRLEPGDDAPSTPAAPLRWNVIGLVAYVAGLTFCLTRFAIGIRQLARIRRCSRPVIASNGEPAWESALVATPVTIGLLTPRVILPIGWREWSPEMLTAVLAHEHAHARRRDPLVAVIARFNTATFWFHPLAWWLERKLATLAEHACDDAALAKVERRRYAEALLDIAGTVRRHHGRLVWQGIGVDGDGRLGQRIDRVLSETSRPRTSRTRRALFATTCAMAIVVAVACQQETKVEPLRENPELAATLKERQQRAESYEAARRMTPEEVAALEGTLQQNPEDTATRDKLLTYYAWTGDNKQRWDENVAARRRHAVWLVENHPDSDLATRVSIPKETDPEGYATLRALWLEHVARKDASAKVLSNAASFFQRSEKPFAEQLLLKGKALQPDGPLPRPTGDGSFYFPSWSERLGRLYVQTILGESDQVDRAWARERLEKSNDPVVLLDGFSLVIRTSDHELQAFGRRLLERASQLDSSTAMRARELLRQLDSRDSGDVLGLTEESRKAALASASGVAKLKLLAQLAQGGYLMFEAYDWRARQPDGSNSASPNVEEDKRKAAEGFAQAKAYAREALDLAPSFKDAGVREATFLARITSGLLAFREGDRKTALDHLREAAKLPPPEQQPAGGWASGLEYRLVFYLLKHGERQTIVDYFERAAQGRDEGRRKLMLASAGAIRDGRMPEHYQYLLASGSL